ncbi:hypothetical protein SAMN04487775_10120 [Treponema bryantii]|uniref:Lipoprotein n=1 Tax=Treponema bryantii TaxID=163 RepID=A0A1I3HRK3_9SPIR|nr:T-complex 10 C-terminal domain-containing protein [Treponema bryantii]SFI38209.1 hypothetical protein SAMN04487775_10120 [Treponema bryantii]
MKKIIVLILFSLILFAACTSVSTTHPDGSKTILYPDGTLEHVN